MSNFAVSLKCLKCDPNQIKGFLPNEEAVFRNSNLAVLGGAVVSKLTNTPECLISSFAVPALIATFTEPAANAVTNRLMAFTEKKYTNLLKRDLPFQGYKDTKLYKCSSYVAQSVLPILATHTIAKGLGYNLSLTQTAFNAFIAPRTTSFLYEKLKTEIAKRQVAANAKAAEEKQPVVVESKDALTPEPKKTVVETNENPKKDVTTPSKRVVTKNPAAKTNVATPATSKIPAQAKEAAH